MQNFLCKLSISHRIMLILIPFTLTIIVALFCVRAMEDTYRFQRELVTQRSQDNTSLASVQRHLHVAAQHDSAFIDAKLALIASLITGLGLSVFVGIACIRSIATHIVLPVYYPRVSSRARFAPHHS
jgi:hypothetical protein